MVRAEIRDEAIALLHTLLNALEAKNLPTEPDPESPESAAEQEDRKAAAAWAARHRIRERQRRISGTKGRKAS